MINENPVSVGLKVAILDLDKITLTHENPEEMVKNIEALMEIYGLVAGTLEGLKEDEEEVLGEV